MTVKEYLKQIERYKLLIAHNQDRLMELRSMLTAIQGVSYDYDRVQSSNHGGMAGVARMVDLELRIKRRMSEYVEISSQIIEQINQLGDTQASELLYLRYVRLMRWEEIACVMHKGIRGVYKSHKRALRLFEEKYRKEFI